MPDEQYRRKLLSELHGLSQNIARLAKATERSNQLIEHSLGVSSLNDYLKREGGDGNGAPDPSDRSSNGVDQENG